MHILDCLVLTNPLYGCETWTSNKAELKKLQAFGMKCLRMVLGITWREHITNAEISSRTFRSIGYFVDNVKSAGTCSARARIAHGKKRVTKNKYSSKES